MWLGMVRPINPRFPHITCCREEQQTNPNLIWSRIRWSAARGTSGTNRFFELRVALSWIAGNFDAEKSLVPDCREACCLVEQWRGRLPEPSL